MEVMELMEVIDGSHGSHGIIKKLKHPLKRVGSALLRALLFHIIFLLHQELVRGVVTGLIGCKDATSNVQPTREHKRCMKDFEGKQAQNVWLGVGRSVQCRIARQAASGCGQRHTTKLLLLMMNHLIGVVNLTTGIVAVVAMNVTSWVLTTRFCIVFLVNVQTNQSPSHRQTTQYPYKADQHGRWKTSIVNKHGCTSCP